MDRAQELELIRSTLQWVQGGPAHGDEATATVDVEVYTDPERFERELDAWHRAHPNFAAHGSELPEPGDFVTREVLDRPVILVRGDDGKVRAFLNVCRHRGARVERKDRGRCKRFVCPYHAWTYARDGSLATVRHPAAFPGIEPAELGLTELACEEASGFVWVAPRVGMEVALDPHLRRLLAEIAGLGPDRPKLFDWGRKLWSANWKLLVEGGIESYHFKIAHKETVGPLFVDTGSTHETFGRHIRQVLPRRTLPELAEQPVEAWRLVQHANVLYFLQPNLSVLVQDGHYALIVMTPVSPGQTRVDLATVGRAPSGEDYSENARSFLQANHDFTVRTLEEDFVLGEQIQAGLSTGANTELRFGRVERALVEFHGELERAMHAP